MVVNKKMLENYMKRYINILISNRQICNYKLVPRLKQQGMIVIKQIQEQKGNLEDVASLLDLQDQMGHLLEQFCKQTEVSALTFGIGTPASKGLDLRWLYYMGYDDQGNFITEQSLGDIASITKSFTTVLADEKRKEGLLSLDELVSSWNESLELGPYTVWDLLYMVGELETSKRVDEASTIQEAWERLYHCKLKTFDGHKNNYTDIGMILLGERLAFLDSQKRGENVNFQDLLTSFCQKHHLMNTVSVPDFNTTSIFGNAHMDGYPHDPKARVLGGIVGSAGLFTTSNDLLTFASYLFDRYKDKSSLVSLFGQPVFFHCDFEKRGIAGCITNKEGGIVKSEVPLWCSRNAWAFQGTTGAVMVNDPKTSFSMNCLVSAIKENGKKATDYIDIYNQLQNDLELYGHLISLIKKFYEEFYGEKQVVCVSKTLKMK